MTTAENFRRVRNLFDAAAERPAHEREAFLEEACAGDPDLRAEVEALLDAREHPQTWIDRPALGTADRMEGRRVGPYEILREIASGGMGTVYLARRADGAFDKRVALKILRPETASPEVLRRFQQEREILAALDHPNIARILDGGRTEDGLPYLTMEFIDGEPIDRYCLERRLDVADRLRLFRSVCAAVRYAHQHGVVHRDLKPSNILVTADGVPKLLDFGISKVLTATADEPTACLTRTGLWLMTPEYASPEQVRGEAAGAPADIYSLGVVLYEMLTGQRPYRLESRVYHEVVRVICEEPPTRPSRAATLDFEKRRLAGDLDAVLLKTLEKQPGRRYRSVEALDSEIVRYLEGRAVEARRPMPIEMAQRIARRNSGLLFGIVLVAGLLASGVIQVQPKFVPALLGFGVGFGFLTLGYAHEFGGEMTRRLMRNAYGMMALAGIIAVLLVFAISKGARDLVAVFNALLILFVLCLLIRWPFRERWWGRLLVDLRRPRPLWFYALALLAAGGAVMAFRERVATGTPWRNLAGVAQVAVLSGWMFALYPRTEIRERGIVNNGQLIPWGRVEGHSWDDARGKAALLRLSVGGWRRMFCGVNPVIVPLHLKEQADAAIRQYLREWPV
jgi:serine/threonine protein kinase